jgi:hypothetical protein
MKSFDQLRKLKPIFEDGDQAYGSIYRNTAPGGDNAVDTPDVSVFDVGHPDTLRRLNAYLSSAAARTAIDPYSILKQIHRKLSIVGLQFSIPSAKLNSKFPGNKQNTDWYKKAAGNLAGGAPTAKTMSEDPNRWTEEYPLAYLGGRYGYLNNEGDIGYDDNIRHRLGHGLKLRVEYTIQNTGMVLVMPSIIPSDLPTNEGFLSTTKAIYRGLTAPLEDPRRSFLQKKRQVSLNNRNKHYVAPKKSLTKVALRGARKTLSGVSKVAAGVGAVGGAAAYHTAKDAVPAVAKAAYKGTAAIARGIKKASPVVGKIARSAGRSLANGARAVGRGAKRALMGLKSYIAARKARAANPAPKTTTTAVVHKAAGKRSPINAIAVGNQLKRSKGKMSKQKKSAPKVATAKPKAVKVSKAVKAPGNTVTSSMKAAKTAAKAVPTKTTSTPAPATSNKAKNLLSNKKP